MKQIKSGEYKTKTCCKCGGPAYWRSTLVPHTFVCKEHGELLLGMERERQKNDAYLSEADYQTWMRL